MTPDDPRHGTNAGATAHWYDGEPACPACAAAKAREAKAADYDKVAGRPRTVRLGRRAHYLLANSPAPQAAAQTGLSQFTIRRLTNEGPSARVRRITRDNIIHNIHAADTWTPVGIQRRIHALHAQGWTSQALATEAGVSVKAVLTLRDREPRQQVRRPFALAVIAAYDRMCTRLPPTHTRRDREIATKARKRAEANGWHPPFAWDDIDNPYAVPDYGTVENRPVGRPIAGTIEDYDFLIRCGESPERAAERVGVNLASIRDQRTRHNRRKEVA